MNSHNEELKPEPALLISRFFFYVSLAFAPDCKRFERTADIRRARQAIEDWLELWYPNETTAGDESPTPATGWQGQLITAVICVSGGVAAADDPGPITGAANYFRSALAMLKSAETLVPR